MSEHRYNDWYKKHCPADNDAEPVIMWSPLHEAAEVYRIPKEWADLTDKQILLLAAERLGYTVNEDIDKDSEEYILYFDPMAQCLAIKAMDDTWEASLTIEIPESLK